MKQLSIEEIEQKIFDVHGQLAKLPIPMDKYNPISGLLIEIKEGVRGLSHQPTPAKIDLEELRERFKNWIETTHSDKIFNWFVPFLSNNTEELKAIIEDREQLIKMLDIKRADLQESCDSQMSEIESLTTRLKECEGEKYELKQERVKLKALISDDADYNNMRKYAKELEARLGIFDSGK